MYMDIFYIGLISSLTTLSRNIFLCNIENRYCNWIVNRIVKFI